MLTLLVFPVAFASASGQTTSSLRGHSSGPVAQVTIVTPPPDATGTAGGETHPGGNTGTGSTGGAGANSSGITSVVSNQNDAVSALWWLIGLIVLIAVLAIVFVVFRRRSTQS